MFGRKGDTCHMWSSSAQQSWMGLDFFSSVLPYFVIFGSLSLVIYTNIFCHTVQLIVFVELSVCDSCSVLCTFVCTCMALQQPVWYGRWKSTSMQGESFPLKIQWLNMGCHLEFAYEPWTRLYRDENVFWCELGREDRLRKIMESALCTRVW